MATGYDIYCEPGDLYTRQCYTGDPAKGGKKIIAYTQSGDPIGFDPISGKTYLVSLDSSGNAYQPYGSAGVPYTAMDGGALSSLLGNWMPSGGASSQDFARLLTLPGAQARIRAANTTVPWYYNVFGLKYNPRVVGQQPTFTYSAEEDSEDFDIDRHDVWMIGMAIVALGVAGHMVTKGRK
jgi:hypothetical protein